MSLRADHDHAREETVPGLALAARSFGGGGALTAAELMLAAASPLSFESSMRLEESRSGAGRHRVGYLFESMAGSALERIT